MDNEVASGTLNPISIDRPRCIEPSCLSKWAREDDHLLYVEISWEIMDKGLVDEYNQIQRGHYLDENVSIKLGTKLFSKATKDMLTLRTCHQSGT